MGLTEYYQQQRYILHTMNDAGCMSNEEYFKRLNKLMDQQMESMKKKEVDQPASQLEFTQGELIVLHMALNNLTLELLPEGSLGGDEIGADLRRGYLAALKSVATKLEIYSR